MRRWLEVSLVLAVAALGVRFTLPRPGSVQPAKVEEKDSDPLGGYRIVGARTSCEDPAICEGRELTRGKSGTVLREGDSRADVVRVLGKPVAFNSDNSRWGYWTRGLPNSKMGILITFDRQERVRRITLHPDWSHLAVELAKPI